MTDEVNESCPDDEHHRRYHWRHRHHPPDTRSIRVSIVKKQGDTVTLTAQALEADGVTEDPFATVTWSQSGPGVTLSSTTGLVVTGTCDTVGDVSFTADAKDPDGNDVPSSPLTVTVVDPATDTKTVTVTAA